MLRIRCVAPRTKPLDTVTGLRRRFNSEPSKTSTARGRLGKRAGQEKLLGP